jgi:Tol biopolymer transport system component/C-terminal processing protease CtpA/Prc
MTLRARSLSALLALGLACFASTASAQTARPSLAEPSLSPDGREIAFISGGDIWTAPTNGGTASLLVTDTANERRPIWSPNGQEIAFTSNRNGSANIYVLTLATGALRRLTFADTNEQLDGWSRDGRWIYFSSNVNDVARQNDVFRVAATGGTPLEVSRERYLNEFNAAPSPDGQSIALMARGLSSDQWWRNGHSHIDEAELWVKQVAASGQYRRIIGTGAKRLWPMWAADGGSLFYMSDQGGSENIWRIALTEGAAAQAVTRFPNGRVLFPSISYDGRTIVFEREFAIWKLDTATGQAAEVAISLRGAPAAAGERRIVETTFRGMAISPDGKKAALIAHGEVFATSTADGGAAQRITDTPGAESDLAWSPDSRRLVYVSERGLSARIMEYDFATQRERALTDTAETDAAPVFSPDGKMIAYARGPSELHVLTFAAAGQPQRDQTIFTGALDRGPGQRVAWSPDSKWIAFPVTDRRSFANVHVIAATGGEARPVSFLANGFTAGQIAWAPDGKYIVFDTAQRSEDAHLVRVDLLPNTPRYREDTFRELFQAQPPGAPSTPPSQRNPRTPAPAPSATPTPDASPSPDATPAAGRTPARTPPNVRIVFEGIRERASFIPVGMSATSPVISPDGKTLVFEAEAGGPANLYSYSLDELASEPPSPQMISSGRRPKGDVYFSSDSKSIFYLDGGRIMTSPIDTPRPKAVEASGEMIVRFEAERPVVFDQAWSALNQSFYDPNFHGQNWRALRDRFQPYALGARTPDEQRRVINLMIGELNASHSGHNPPGEGFGAAPAPRVADLGLRFDREAYEAGRGLTVREVIDLGPAAIEGSIKAGDVLTAIDGRQIGAGVNLDSLLLDKAGKRTVLTVSTAGRAREVIVRPIAPGVARGLLYRHWVNDRRAYVERVSNGRLGYVHIIDMSEDSLNQLYIDLDAQNQGREGVVIDIRNNNGGFVNGYVLDVFTRRNFLTMTTRNLFGVPSRQALGQRSLGLPTVLVTNESSLSDAEDFTEGYRYLQLGKVVGVPTAGWIIYTSPRQLIDGSSVRVPSTRIEGVDGRNMELNPRPVDITVERPLGETLAGRDSQLDAAVRQLISQLPAR